MKISTHDTLPIVSIAALCAFAWYLYPSIPEPMAIHWSLDGSPNGFSSRGTGIAIFVAIPAIAFLCLRLLPLISPSGYRMTQSRHTYALVIGAVTVVLAGISASALVSATDGTLRAGLAGPVLLGSLFVVFGNYMGKVERNWIFGIRTPWTLASEEVWFRTHRAGRWIWLAAGLILLVTPLLGLPPLKTVVQVTIVATIVSVLYSLAVYIRLHGLSDS